jgi:vacuolar-type H+-ATPase subunit H
MKHAENTVPGSAEQAIKQVLQAERDAENAVRDCEAEAHQIIKDAQLRAKEIESRTDQRITNMEMRHSHKLDQLIRSIEKEGEVRLEQDVDQNVGEKALQTVIEKLAIELCQGDPAKSGADGDS